MKLKAIAIAIFSILLLVSITEFRKPTGLAASQTVQTNMTLAVNLVYNNLSVENLTYVIPVPPGNTSENNFNVTAELPGNSGLNITFYKSGDIADWITLETNILNLTPGEKQEVRFNVTPPPSQSQGIYYGWINVTSSDGQQEDINITANVSIYVGRINVSVNDSIGNPVEAATVFIWNMVPLLKDSGSTDEYGNWLSKWLDSGNYTVEVIKGGYQTARLNVSVNNSQMTQAFITLYPVAAPVLDVTPSSISESAYVNQQVTRILTVMNIGDMNLINITLNSSQSWISFNIQFIPNITPGNYTYVNAYLGPISTPGIYYGSIFVNSSNDGSKTIPVVFQVNPIITPPGPGGGGGGFLLKPNLTIIEYPERIIVNQGEIRFLSVYVKNAGETHLFNTSVEILGIDRSWYSVEPVSFDLFMGKTQAFIIKLTIPRGATPQDIPIVFKAYSGFITDVKAALLSIEPVGLEILRVDDVSVSKFIRNQKGTINITLENLVARPINATVDLDFPENFVFETENMSKVIAAHQKKSFVFEAMSPEANLFEINMTVHYEGRRITRFILINVYDYDINVVILSIMLGVLIIILIAFYHKKKKRRVLEKIKVRKWLRRF